MKRRLFSLVVASGLVAASLTHPIAVPDSCEECREECNNIPMDPDECLQLYCPECAGTSTPMGGIQTGSGR
jgi:hypothetical protein